ncbi:MAG TPA: septal ring lytic transglycosylase RlpA family protein [Solirubrobacteraceae bacterium]|nr:septal ring lytic transglycosylase RlpA family protein [Solirubrobacteraceae bacterium]
MYVPATSTPAAPAAPLAAIELASDGVSPGASTLTGLVGTPTIAATHVSLVVRHEQLNVLAGHTSTVAGALEPGLAGQKIRLQALTDHGWRTLASTVTGRGGRFRVRYTPVRDGSQLVRLRFNGDSTARPARKRLGRLNVFRLAEASWYGGGGGLACGGELTSATIGVANKTLPCGTLLTLRYGGRSLRVRVIDRGPYVAGREFDLTEATKRALGFGGVGEVWATR